MGQRGFRQGVTSQTAAGSYRKLTARPTGLPVISVDGTLIETHAVGPGCPPPRLVFSFQAHSAHRTTVMLSLVESFEGVCGRMKSGFCRNTGRLVTMSQSNPPLKSQQTHLWVRFPQPKSERVIEGPRHSSSSHLRPSVAPTVQCAPPVQIVWREAP